MVHLVNDRYVCDWCAADLDLPFEEHETITVVTEHDGMLVRVIKIDGEERHRCSRPVESERSSRK